MFRALAGALDARAARICCRSYCCADVKQPIGVWGGVCGDGCCAMTDVVIIALIATAKRIM